MGIIKFRKIWFLVSGFLVTVSVLFLALWQLNFGIDFTGGSLMEIKWLANTPSFEEIKEVFSKNEIDEVIIQPAGSSETIFRFKYIDEVTHQALLNNLKEKFGELQEERFETIGSIIGKELKRKALWSICLSLIAILIFVAWAFRKVSFPVQSYKYGLIAIVALFHDVLITIGIFSFLGHFYGIEVNVPFVAALLTILGYSVNDTIVVFDRIREKLRSPLYREQEFSKVVEFSLKETLVRSINTSLTTLLVLFAILFFGGETVRYFILALVLGILFGTYSSIFIAAPLLVSWEKYVHRNLK